MEYATYTIAADGMILKDGHTMLVLDIVKDLNRKSYLENRYAELLNTVKGALRISDLWCPSPNDEVQEQFQSEIIALESMLQSFKKAVKQ